MSISFLCILHIFSQKFLSHSSFCRFTFYTSGVRIITVLRTLHNEAQKILFYFHSPLMKYWKTVCMHLLLSIVSCFFHFRTIFYILKGISEFGDTFFVLICHTVDEFIFCFRIYDFLFFI